MPSLADWKPQSHHVQGGIREGQFVNSQYAVICAGPPFLKNLIPKAGQGAAAAGMFVYPIGMTQQFSLGQNKAFSRIMEIGSNRAYFISGHSFGQVGLGRIMLHGPSLLRVMYAYYDTSNDTDGYAIKSLMGIDGAPTPFGVPPVRGTNVGEQSISADKNLHTVRIPPGYDNLFINLASDLFSQPIGLFVVIKDNEENIYGQFYMEQCYIPSHSMGFDSQGMVISESISVQYERLIPIQSNQVALVRDVGGFGDMGRLTDWSGGYIGGSKSVDQ